MRCLQLHYGLSTATLWTLYRLSTDSLQPTMDSLQTLYSYYGLSTDSLQLLWTDYSCLWLSMPPHCSSAAAVLLQCCAEHRGLYRHYSTAGTAAAFQSLLMGLCRCHDAQASSSRGAPGMDQQQQTPCPEVEVQGGCVITFLLPE
jgi:hypothetical protein